MLQKRAESKVNELITKACDGLIKQAENYTIDKESFDAVSRLIEALNSGSNPEDSTNVIGFHAGPEECDAE